MASTVKKVLSKFAPPALTANSESKPSDNFQTSPSRVARRSASLSPTTSDEDDKNDRNSRKHGLRYSLIDSIRSRRSTSQARSSVDGDDVPNGDDHANGDAHPVTHVPRPDKQERSLSMTEQKEARKTEREEKEESEAEKRRRRHREAWEKVTRYAV